MFVSKILASDLRYAILDMSDLLGISVVDLLLQQLENQGILSDDNSKTYTFDELNDAMVVIFGDATSLFMLQLEKRLQDKKN
ncbi:MAG: hypothetical protein AB1351_06485 [Thermoproteota archaeon]